jgi:hypothetical protein
MENPFKGFFFPKSELMVSEINYEAIQKASIFEHYNQQLIKLNEMILAVVSLMDQKQIDAFPQAYADRLAARQLSIASSNKEAESNPSDARPDLRKAD